MSTVVRSLTGAGGYFRIFVRRPGGVRTDITLFRGVPTQIESMSSADPFGDATASLSFAQITGKDRPGSGDLDWLVPWSDVDIVWYNEDNAPTPWVWEGFIVSEDIGSPYKISLKGALYQADNYLAAPWYPQYPVPYEILISQVLSPSFNPTLRTTPLRVVFPDDWTTVVPAPSPMAYLWYLKPWGVSVGQKWTGLTSRSTGSWEPLLTGFIQALLGVMFTADGGQWTITKDTGRAPVLHVRSVLLTPTEDTLVVYYGAPGVELTLSRDFTQSANVVYGTGSDLHGTTFSGQQVSADGKSTYYEPFSFMPTVHPRFNNPRLNPNFVRKETRLTFTPGMSHLEAEQTAQTHLQRFADPGYTGTLNLTSDPLLGGVPFNKHLIRAGRTILVKGFRGADLMFHISEATVNPKSGTAVLSIDSKFRDALTVDDVKARTRDALDPVKQLQVGKFTSTVQDSVKPWSYSTGSGVIPSGGSLDATNLFTRLMDPNERFPWTNATRTYPPSRYPNYYIKIGPRDANANNNWCGVTRDNKYHASVPIKMSQSGTIRLSQFAIYDENGYVLPSRFHIAIYTETATRDDMPTIWTGATGTGGYPAGQHYPFFEGAFEQTKVTGEQQNQSEALLAQSAGLVIGWGNYYEGAGYYPGTSSAGNPPTGMLVDETPWGFDTTGNSSFDVRSAKNTQNDSNAGILSLEFYCDGQGSRPVFLLGRLWRQES